MMEKKIKEVTKEGCSVSFHYYLFRGSYICEIDAIRDDDSNITFLFESSVSFASALDGAHLQWKEWSS